MVQDIYALYEGYYTQETHIVWSETLVCDDSMDEGWGNMHTQKNLESCSLAFDDTTVLKEWSW